MKLDDNNNEDVPLLLGTSIDKGKSALQQLDVKLRDFSLIKVPITIVTGMRSKSL